jgi:hypothetical protein
MVVEIWCKDEGIMLYHGIVAEIPGDPPRLLINGDYAFRYFTRDGDKLIFLGPYDREPAASI